jgi:hypothetical protein
MESKYSQNSSKFIHAKFEFNPEGYWKNPIDVSKHYVDYNNSNLLMLFDQNGYDLTEIIRQQNTNPLLEVLSLLRDDIINSTHNYVDYLKNNPLNMTDKEGYKVLSGSEFGQEMIACFKSMEYQKDRNHVRYISWTNQAIQKANTYIRNYVYNNTPNPINIAKA